MARILIADDEDSLDIVAQILEFDGHEVVTATNGQEACARARELRPDLILMDALMPVMDGYEATAALKADPATRAVPILFWTCNGSVPEVRERALGVGADDLADKPLELNRLRRQIETWSSRTSSS